MSVHVNKSKLLLMSQRIAINVFPEFQTLRFMIITFLLNISYLNGGVLCKYVVNQMNTYDSFLKYEMLTCGTLISRLDD